ncbi:MAG: DUF6788 family protein [Blastocatellia bacterium]
MSDTFEDPLNDLLWAIATGQDELLNKHSPSPQKKDVSRQSRARVSPQIKNQDSLPKIEPLPGAVCKQMKRCGKPNCKCAKGELHGPYYYRFVYVRGKQLKIYVKKGEFQTISAACLAYKRDRQETRELIRSINESGNRLLRAMGDVLRSWKL